MDEAMNEAGFFMRDMNTIVGSHDIVLITLDTLRYDVAVAELAAGRLPVLSHYIERWEKRHSPGSFTFSAHQAIFAGFLPTPFDNPGAPRLMALSFAGSETTVAGTWVFDAPTIVEGLNREGYRTLCIGGVGFFNPNTALGSVLPAFFQESHWSPALGVTNRASTAEQVALACARIGALSAHERLFLFINISAIHQPNYFYLPSRSSRNNMGSDNQYHAENQHHKVEDNLHTHAAALRYVDSQLPPLFEAFKARGDTLFILCSDHGTAYGEDGYRGHRLAHEVVWTVPYAEFVQKRGGVSA